MAVRETERVLESINVLSVVTSCDRYILVLVSPSIPVIVSIY